MSRRARGPWRGLGLAMLLTLLLVGLNPGLLGGTRLDLSVLLSLHGLRIVIVSVAIVALWPRLVAKFAASDDDMAETVAAARYRLLVWYLVVEGLFALGAYA